MMHGTINIKSCFLCYTCLYYCVLGSQEKLLA